jgi:hypothetical protein
VPFIRIRTENVAREHQLISYRDERGRERTVPLLRLRLAIHIGKDSDGPPVGRRARKAILDTGAPLSIFPKQRWQSFASEIVRLPFVGERAPVGRVGGRQFSYFLGRVWINCTDPFERHLPAVPVLAQFREDDIPAGERLPPILLGLSGGILEGRTLTRWPTVERYDPDLPALESFGQWWHLSEP